MKQYTDLVRRILTEGEERKDRTGTGTLSVFGGHMTFDLRYRFPLVTVKETRWRTAFLEMLWFLRGESNTEFLHANGCKLWDAWADKNGQLGPIYGSQWRRWDGVTVNGKQVWIDQIRNLIDGIKRDPMGRRHIVSAWNVAQVDDMALPPCHWAFQCYASNDGSLDMQVSQRSWDVALGAPFNIAQYALLLVLLARATGREPRRLSFAYGDAHLYLNHVDAMREVIERPHIFQGIANTTALVVNTENIDIDGYKIDDFEIVNYLHHPHVRLPISV